MPEDAPLSIALTVEEAASVVEILRFPTTSHGQSVVEAAQVADRLERLLSGYAALTAVGEERS